MQRESRSIGFVCAVGAFAGTALALQWSHSWFLTLAGLLVGGLIAYVAQDIRGFARDIVRAWQAVATVRLDGRKLGEAMLTSFLVWTCFLLWSKVVLVMATSHPHGLEWLIKFFTAMNLFGVLFGTLLFTGVFYSNEYDPKQATENRRIRSAILYYVNPVVVPFWALVGVWWCAINTPRLVLWAWATTVLVARKTARFAWTAFKYVHSAERRLCFTDAVIGGAVGFYYGSPVVGALVGAVLGVMNYELVSVRLLKLAPARR